MLLVLAMSLIQSTMLHGGSSHNFFHVSSHVNTFPQLRKHISLMRRRRKISCYLSAYQFFVNVDCTKLGPLDGTSASEPYSLPVVRFARVVRILLTPSYEESMCHNTEALIERT